MNQQLLDYIKKQLEEGRSKEEIKKVLMDNGWQGQDVEDAFNAVSASSGIEPPSPPLVGQQSFLPEVQPSSAQVSQPSASAVVFLGAFALLKNALSIYKQRFATFLGIMAIPMIIPASLIAAIIILLLVAMGGGYLNLLLSFLKFAGENRILLISLVVIITIVAALLQLWAQVSLLYAIKDRDEKVGIRESYRRGLRKFFSYWWVAILTGIIIGGGILLFAVPGIIFAVWFSLALYILVAEDIKGTDALLKSREYVRGKWGAVFWRLLFIFIFSFVISLAIALTFNALFIFISQIALPILLGPLIITYLFLIYSNLKSLKGEFVFVPTAKQKATPMIIGILGFALIFGVMLFLGLRTLFCDVPILKNFSTKCLPVLLPARELAPSSRENFVKFELDNNVNLIGTNANDETKVLFNLADVFKARRDLLSFPYKILSLDPAFYNRARNLFIVGPLNPSGYPLSPLLILNLDTKSVADTSYFANVFFDQPYAAGLAISRDRLKVVAFRNVTCGDANEIYVFHSPRVERLNFKLRKDETIILPSGGRDSCNAPDVQWIYNEQTREETIGINVYDRNNFRSEPVRSINVSIPTADLPEEGEHSPPPPFGTIETERANILMRDEQRIKDAKQIQLALELYFDDNGHYPLFFGRLIPKYLSEIPKDPLTGGNYFYAPLQIGVRCDSYHLGVALENRENPILKFAKRAVASSDVCDGFLGSDFNAGGLIYDVKP